VADALPTEFTLLQTSLAAVPDLRKARGRRYPLVGVLSLVVRSLMAGCRSLSAMHRFGVCHPEVLPVLGLRGVPSVPTFSRVLDGVGAEAVRDALRTFAGALVAQRGAAVGVVAMDGKTLRGVHADSRRSLTNEPLAAALLPGLETIGHRALLCLGVLTARSPSILSHTRASRPVRPAGRPSACYSR
jgi:hypothetical protein